MRFCGACGAQAGPTLRFCTSCGANLHAAAGGPAPVPEPLTPAPWPVPVATSWAAPEPLSAAWDAPDEDWGGRRPLLVAGAALGALLLVGSGYLFADRVLLADDVAPIAQDGPAPAPAGPDAGGPSPAAGSTTTPGTTSGTAPGAASPAGGGPLLPRSVTASCQAPPGVDAAGQPVTYDAANVLDGVGGTAWRCAGSAVGHQLVFDFGRLVTLTSVALVPGYDKVDPVDGTDRFGENRTVTAVTWRFDGGASQRQEIAVPTRAMAQERLGAPVTTTRLVLEIAATGNDGAVRDFTTISDVAFTGSG